MSRTRSSIQLLLVLVLCALPNAVSIATQAELVPWPSSIEEAEPGSTLELGEKILVSIPSNQPLIAGHFSAFGEALKRLVGCELEVLSDGDSTSEKAGILLLLDSALPLEAYRLSISGDRILIQASGLKGVSHATATLLQLVGRQNGRTLPQLKIEDQPACSYRNLMVDLGRNPHSVELLRETIDLLWYYKLDSLQLHLTDDQRFAFPSKAFPKMVTQSDSISWEEFAELENYAQVRGVTLIPELEVPGHSTLLRKAYPEVFGNTPTELATRKASRDAIKLLLDEMMELFPSSPYVHIGGDEAYGVPVDLQRDLINELHAHLKSKGKKAIVWEGPSLGEGENKVNEEVIHINWRTIEFPAGEMLDAGYPVVNAAWDPLYVVDHYPRNNFTMASPEYIYRNLDLYRFKHFNPGIRTFQNPIQVEPNENLIGFCLPWWEGREVNYFPLVVPRLIPMAEVAWNSKKPRDFPGFQKRSIASEIVRRRCFSPISISASPIALEREGVFHDQTTVAFDCQWQGNGEIVIRYTLDGSQPTTESSGFVAPFVLQETATVRAAAFMNGKQLGHGARQTYICVQPVSNLALGKNVTTNITSGPLFSTARLTDGGTGNLDYFLGYPSEPEPILITVDLGKVTPLNRVVTHSFFGNNAFESYEVQVSRDGETFSTVADRREKPEKPTAMATHDFPQTEARFIRIKTHGCKGYVFDSFSKLTEIQAFLIEPRKSP